MPLLINIVFLLSQSNVHSSSDSDGEQSSETNSSVSDEENQFVPSNGKEASESSSSPSQEEQPLFPVVSMYPGVIETREGEQIQNPPTSESLDGGIRVSQLFSFE